MLGITHLTFFWRGKTVGLGIVYLRETSNCEHHLLKETFSLDSYLWEITYTKMRHTLYFGMGEQARKQKPVLYVFKNLLGGEERGKIAEISVFKYQ